MTEIANRHDSAWYFGTREDFLTASRDSIANQLASRAVDEGLDTEPTQGEEWRRSVEILRRSLDERIPILRQALMTSACDAIRHVVLRLISAAADCAWIASFWPRAFYSLLNSSAPNFDRAALDQVMGYAVNLIEFHRVTREWCQALGAVVVPILARTQGKARTLVDWPGLSGNSWPMLARRPIECDRTTMGRALAIGLSNRRSSFVVSADDSLDSPFQPSSSILDATLSLYGNHDVVAIQDHSAPKAAIDASTHEIRQRIDDALAVGAYHIVFLSGSPGSGKTLVGLDIVMRGKYAACSVFVTGNAPLVDVLNGALGASYRSQGRRDASWTPTGYRRADAKLVASAAGFKIVKAHNFLGQRGQAHRQEDGRVMVFDEAQRTYEKGRTVFREELADHEADLILVAQRNAFLQVDL